MKADEIRSFSSQALNRWADALQLSPIKASLEVQGASLFLTGEIAAQLAEHNNPRVVSLISNKMPLMVRPRNVKRVCPSKAPNLTVISLDDDTINVVEGTFEEVLTLLGFAPELNEQLREEQAAAATGDSN